MHYRLWIIKIDFTYSPLEFSDWKEKKIKKEKVSQERHALLIYY